MRQPPTRSSFMSWASLCLPTALHFKQARLRGNQCINLCRLPSHSTIDQAAWTLFSHHFSQRLGMHVHPYSVVQSCLTLCDPMNCSPQAPLSIGFSRQEYWSGLPFPTLGDLPDPGIEPMSLVSPGTLHWQADSCQSEHRG